MSNVFESHCKRRLEVIISYQIGRQNLVPRCHQITWKDTGRYKILSHTNLSWNWKLNYSSLFPSRSRGCKEKRLKTRLKELVQAFQRRICTWSQFLFSMTLSLRQNVNNGVSKIRIPVLTRFVICAVHIDMAAQCSLYWNCQSPSHRPTSFWLATNAKTSERNGKLNQH